MSILFQMQLDGEWVIYQLPAKIHTQFHASYNSW